MYLLVCFGVVWIFKLMTLESASKEITSSCLMCMFVCVFEDFVMMFCRLVIFVFKLLLFVM